MRDALQDAVHAEETSSCATRFHDIDLPLQRIYSSELQRPLQPFLTQPKNGQVQTWTWSEAMVEIRRIVAWINEQNWPPGSRIVILSKNCAWWIMADIAIWVSGHVSVPFFPELRDESLAALFAHSEPVACFLGELDQPPPFGAEPLQNVRFIRFPNTKPDHFPPSTEDWQSHRPQRKEHLKGQPVRAAEDLATIIYTSGTTGQPKGVMQSFRSLSLMGKSMEPALGNSPYPLDRILSYLPLAHIAERAIVEMNSLICRSTYSLRRVNRRFSKISNAQSAQFSSPFLASFFAFQQGVFGRRFRRRSLSIFSRSPS